MKKSLSYPVIFMISITVIFTFILAILNYSTAAQIDYNQQTKIRSTLLYVFNIEAPTNTPQSIEETYNKYIKEFKSDGTTIYSANDGDNLIGYAFTVDGNALWGSVKGFAAISHDFSKLLGVDFVSHSETPGLGGRISELWYKEQFRGLDLENVDNNQYIIYRPASGGNVDAVTGATLTSKSVRDFMNEDIYNFIEKFKGGELLGK